MGLVYQIVVTVFDVNNLKFSNLRRMNIEKVLKKSQHIAIAGTFYYR
jgi:hypothetical protein